MRKALTVAILIWIAASRALAQSIGIPDVPALSVVVEPREALDQGWSVQGQIVLTVRIASKPLRVGSSMGVSRRPRRRS